MMGDIGGMAGILLGLSILSMYDCARDNMGKRVNKLIKL